MLQRTARALYVPFLILSIFAMRIGWLIPDGVAYCSYLPTLILDGDLNFWNQYAASGVITREMIHGATISSNGHVVMLWGVGAALLWMPFWLLGHLLTMIAAALHQSWTPNGFTFYYNFGIRFGTAVMALSALALNIRYSREYCSARSAVAGVLLTAIGTPFYWYTFHFADYAHIPAALSISLFLIVWQIYRTERAKTYGFLLGLLGGLIMMIKPNQVFVFLFPIAMWLAQWKKESFNALLKQAGWMFLGAIVAFGIQIWIWQILFGNPLGPILEKGVRHYYGFFAGRFWLVDVLSSSYHGLFFFSPLLICSFVGLILLLKVDRIMAVPSLIILILQILLMANERYFWEGTAFGLRRMVDWTPLFALGTAYSLDMAFKRKWMVLPIAATAWTILLAFTYSRHPAGVLNDYQPPRLILSWIAQALREIPDAMRSALSLPAPARFFFPAFLVFAAAGYVFYRSILRLADTNSPDVSRLKFSLETLMVAVLSLVLIGYALVSRASMRDEQSLTHYARQLESLRSRQDASTAMEQVTFLVSEGKYIALSRNWNSARSSFAEALLRSPVPVETSQEIRQFLLQHLDPDAAGKYLNSISPQPGVPR
jgi:hypothetical protein